MKILIWSAFAMSLFMSSQGTYSQSESVDDFLGMETEILPELEGSHRFTPQELHPTAAWNVKEKDVERDQDPLKGQGHSLIPWSTLDPETWLDIETWLTERAVKDTIPDWKVRLRINRQNEQVGKILKCTGSCSIYRGTNAALGQHLSRLEEGDELKTGVDSVAWVFLMDGTLVRLGPLSSVSMQEMNWSAHEVFYLVRLNQGHLFWHPRETNEQALDLAPETDLGSLPVLVREANQTYFERQRFQKQNDQGHLSEVLELDEAAVKAQFQELNRLRAHNQSLKKIATKVMIVAPNASLVSSDISQDILYYPGGKTYFKKRSPGEERILSLHLRGYTQTQTLPVNDEKWYEVASNGREYLPLLEPSGDLQVIELLTKRIKTMELAREIWVSSFTAPILKVLDQPKDLATGFGYTLWGEEKEKRFDFLVEYTRRVETTNLKAIENLMKKLEGRGESITPEASDRHYRGALTSYLKSLKSRSMNHKMKVREMNDLQYYVWILKNGKF